MTYVYYRLLYNTTFVSYTAKKLEKMSAGESVRPELDKRPPVLGKEDVVSLIIGHFPFKSVSSMSLKQLPSYDDRMFYFEGEFDDESLDHSLRKPFVLKISNKSFGRDLIASQNAVMLHLAARGVNCCRPIVCRRGHYLEMLNLEVLLSKPDSRGWAGNEAEYAVRVLQYIPGEPMDNIDKRYLTPRLMYCVGNHVAKMDIVLQVQATKINFTRSDFTESLAIFARSFFCEYTITHEKKALYPDSCL